MDKYLALFNYLSSIKNNTILLFFSEIEKIINAKLPIPAYEYRECWSNWSDTIKVQCQNCRKREEEGQ